MLAKSRIMSKNSRVRFGCLTGNEHHGRVTPNPEFLAGLCGRTRGSFSVRLPSQGPAPLSTWGFSLGECFVVAGCEDRVMGQSIQIETIGPAYFDECRDALQVEALPSPQSICTDRQGASANGPAWAAPRIIRRKEDPLCSRLGKMAAHLGKSLGMVTKT